MITCIVLVFSIIFIVLLNTFCYLCLLYKKKIQKKLCCCCCKEESINKIITYTLSSSSSVNTFQPNDGSDDEEDSDDEFDNCSYSTIKQINNKCEDSSLYENVMIPNTDNNTTSLLSQCSIENTARQCCDNLKWENELNNNNNKETERRYMLLCSNIYDDVAADERYCNNEEECIEEFNKCIEQYNQECNECTKDEWDK
ncbi:hypothetical protein [Cetacean poxvirus 1]|nr:hypothetical protein [Cetacean poxvirus 1]